jgi:hypothetical protein
VDESHAANVGVVLSTCAAQGLAQCVQGVEQVTLPRPWSAVLHRLQREQLSHRLPSSNKPGITIFHQHFGNQRARVVVR